MDILNDNTTIVKNHTIKTHIFCILLRMILGISIINGIITKEVLIAISLFVICTFLFKYFNTDNWKNYLRTVLAYSVILFVDKNTAGTIVIIDALMGQQTRHTRDLFEKLLKLQ